MGRIDNDTHEQYCLDLYHKNGKDVNINPCIFDVQKFPKYDIQSILNKCIQDIVPYRVA